MPNGTCVNIPTLRVHNFPRCAITFSAEGVEIKGKSLFICTKMCVGFGSDGHKAYILSGFVKIW